MSRLDAIIEALHAAFGAADGLTALLDYEPRAAHAPPLLYSLLDSAERRDTAAQSEVRYRILHRVLLGWQDPAASEAALRRYAEQLPALVAADPQLGGLLLRGRAAITEIRTGFVAVDGAEHRVLDIYSDVLDKRAPTTEGA